MKLPENPENKTRLLELALVFLKLRASPLAGGFLDGVNAASLSLNSSVSRQLGAAALKDGLSVAFFGRSRFGFHRRFSLAEDRRHRIIIP